MRQIWHFIHQGYDQYKIVNMYDGRCLDTNGTDVQVLPPALTSGQLWKMCAKDSYSPSTLYYIVPPPALAPNHETALDVDHGDDDDVPAGRNVHLFINQYGGSGSHFVNGGPFHEAQTFQIIAINDNIETVLTRYANNAFDSDFYARVSYQDSHLETTGVITENGYNMDVVTCKTLKPNDEKQIWHFIRQDNGSYKIVNEYAGWCLDVSDGIAEDGVRVRTWSLDNGSAAQRWYLMKSPGDSTCRIASALGFPNSIYSLDVPVSAPDAAASDGMRPTVFKQHQNANQQFTITRVDPPSPPDPEILPDAITNVEADPAGKTVLAALQNRTEAVLTGAVYSRTGRLLSAAMTPVSANCGLAALRFQTLPAGCTIKLALLDSGTWRPLCAAYQISP